MEKLGLVDQALYKLETSGFSPLYMCGATVVDATDSPHPVDAKALAGHIAACMEEIPLMRQKLVQDPIKLGDLRLVDDPDFDVHNHITVTKIEAPGGYAELMDCLGTFSAQRMDLSRPLWRFEVIEGLEGGKLAVAMHLHHSIIDGEGSKHALAGVWSNKPIAARKPSKDSWTLKSEPSSFKLLKNALIENTQRIYVKTPAFILKSATPMLKMAADQIRKKFDAPDEQDLPGATLPKVQLTSLNVPSLSDKRAVCYAEVSLAEVKKLRKHYACSINDLAMALCSNAFQYYFDETGEDVDFDLIAGMPISLRSAGDTERGNKLGAARVNLYNSSVKGIDKQLKAINADTTEIKNKKAQAEREAEEETSPSIDFNELTTLFSPIVLDGLFYAALKFNFFEKVPIANMMVTNVPGVPGQAYMAGAKLSSNIPMGPCLDGLGITVCITSSDELLSFGFHGCGEAIKDKELFVEGIHSGFAELKRLAKKKTGKKTTKKVSARRSKAKTKSSKA